MKGGKTNHSGYVRGAAPASSFALLLALGACEESPTPPPPPDEEVQIILDPVVSGLDQPVYVTTPPGETERLFIVEQDGLVRIYENGTLLEPPFLDVTALVSRVGSEQGLLSIAFHPDYATNGWLYVDYTDTDDDTQVVRYSVSANPNVADAGSATPVLTVRQPYRNHNGGLLLFGPDGLLYVGLGDGGDANDRDGHGQNLETLLGTILRLDVDASAPYAIPLDNPFVGQAPAREEIWAYGLRNPWRFSFDPATGDLWIADVGQREREEVSVEPAGSGGGRNYGWSVMEGSRCFDPPSGCDQTGLTLPVHDYGHDDGCSITGGYVYRGSEYPALQGRYFYADFCSDWIRSFVLQAGTAADHREHDGVPGIASFGEDAAGELYVVSRQQGRIYRITAP